MQQRNSVNFNWLKGSFKRQPTLSIHRGYFQHLSSNHGGCQIKFSAERQMGIYLIFGSLLDILFMTHSQPPATQH